MNYFFIIFFISISFFITTSSFFLVFLVKKILNKQINKKDLLFSFLGAVAYLVALILLRENHYDIVRNLFYYLGFLNFSIMTLGLFSLFSLFQCIFKFKSFLKNRVVNIIFLLLPFIFSMISIYNFEKGISVENVEITSDKISQEYRFVQVSDIQYGTVTKNYLNKIIKLIIEQDADFVVFTGDLVDFDNYVEEDLEILNTIPVPVYFERGNHEFYHFPGKILSYLESIGPVDVLLNEKISFNEIDIVGIDYQSNGSTYKSLIDSIALDVNQFSILLYHEPKNVEYSAGLGFDLLLYGHTHGGQIWPFTEAVDYIYKYADGLFKVGESYVYTSDGAALWGPRMRLGSQNEIVVFTLTPVI